MTTIYSWLWLFFILVVGASPTTAQQDWTSLLNEVNQSIKQTPEQAIHLKYTQTLVPHVKEQKIQVVEVELRQQGKRQSKITTHMSYFADAQNAYAIITTHMSYFADAQNAYAIYPTAQKIFVLNAWQQAQRQLQEGATKMDIQQLWEGAKIQEIKALKAGNKRVQIIPTKRMQQLGQVLTIELEFDAQSHVLRQSKLYLSEEGLYKQVLFDYTHVKKAKEIALFDNAKEQVFDHQGNLLKKYQHFAVEQR